LAYPAEPPTLDPLAPGGASAATRDILRPVLPALFRLDASLKPQPELAAAWPGREQISLDPFTVTLRLRKATWSDGEPISATDVRFSWTKFRDGPTRHRYRFLRDVEAVAQDTVRLEFDRPVRRWWALFSIDDMVLPEHAYSPEWKDGPTISGGPFAFKGWTRGLRVRLVRNERFGVVVPLAGIDVLFVPSDETRLQLLERGEVDLVSAEGESNVGRRAQAHGFGPVGGALEGKAGASSVWGPTWWELDLDPGKMGEAVARATMEAASPDLVAEILEDSGRPMNSIPADFAAGEAPKSPEAWAGRSSIAEAEKALNGKRGAFQLGYASGGPAGALAAFLHFGLREIGVTVELVGVEPDTFEGTFVPSRSAPAMIRLRRGADAPDAGAYGAASLQPGGAAIDDQVVASEISTEPERLRSGPVTGLDATGWTAAQRGLVQAATAVPLARTRSFLVGAGGVWGPRPMGAANGPLWNAADWRLER
jgi:ABC-type transport system substrate-binding protein